MSTATTDLNAVQEYVLDAVKQTQELTLETARTIVDAVSPLFTALPTAPFADLLPDPAATVDAGFEFADQILAAQRDFTRELVGVLTPKAEATPAA